MNTLEKLHVIEDRKVIYDIHYCVAGVGFLFYEADKDPGGYPDSFKQALVVEKYYPTFEEAVDGEFARLKPMTSLPREEAK